MGEKILEVYMLGKKSTKYTLKNPRIRTVFREEAINNPPNLVRPHYFSKAGKSRTIPQREVLRIVEAAAEEEGCPEGASFRWSVVAAEDNFLRMQLQSLPGQAVLLSGKALLKG